MRWVMVVVVVRCLVLENDVQPDISVAVVDGTDVILSQRSAREVDDTRMDGQVFPASIKQGLSGIRGIVEQGEVDVVGDHG
jgi:hypothetical protein